MSVLFDLLFRVLARIQAIGASFVVRLTSPGTWQQLAPLVALGRAVAWYLWNRAGRSVLGRAARWWVGFLALFGLLTPPIYFQAVLPDGAAGLVAIEINASRLGRAQFPAEMVIVALVVMVASAGFRSGVGANHACRWPNTGHSPWRGEVSVPDFCSGPSVWAAYPGQCSRYSRVRVWLGRDRFRY